MVNIRAKLMLEKGEIQNERPLQLKFVSPSRRILTDILKFHTKSR